MSELFVIEGSAKDFKEALTLTGTELFNQGCVKDSFVGACIAREEDYWTPTGLNKEVPIAIPHATKEHVIKQAICVLKLKEPVQFRTMADVDQWADMKYVFNLALLDDREHMVILQNVVNNIKDPAFIDEMDKMSIDELKEVLQTKFFANLKED